jgi:hypothetical protein
MMPAPSERRWSLVSAVLGGGAWLGAPYLPGSPPALGSIEHVFLFLPLVAAPLALLLQASLVAEEGGPCAALAPRGRACAALTPRGRGFRLHAAARYAQPAASAMVLASFCLAKGNAAGALTGPWLIMAVLVAAGGIAAVKPARGPHRSNVSLLASHLFLAPAAIWLLLSRLGVGPRSFTEMSVFLAALHFHASGFLLQVLVAATGRLVREASVGALHRVLAVGAIVGIPLIALGKAVPSETLKYGGVAVMVASTIALAVTSTSVAFDSRPPAARMLLLASAGSIAAGMILAAICGVGEIRGGAWMSIPRMVQTHGLLNALGFTLCGLSAHLYLRARDPTPSPTPSPSPSPTSSPSPTFR